MRTAVLLSTALVALATACSNDTKTIAPAEPLLSVNARESHDGNDRTGAVYVLSNNVDANAVLVFPRAPNGTLGAATSVPTGGRGTGGGLGNQYGLILDDEQEFLYGVDAGSNEISAFRVTDASLRQTDRVSSGGTQPISIAVHDKLVYVLNDGAEANISGFRVSPQGKLTPINRSTRARSAPAGSIDGAEIAFSPDGKTLVVTEKAANLVVSYPVLENGRTGEPHIQQSSGATPFGFDFTKRGSIVVAEAQGGVAGLSTVSSYRIDRRSNISLTSASIPNGGSAVCWIVVSKDGRTAYAANTGSQTVSTFSIGTGGSLALIDDTAGSVGVGSSPSDMGLSAGDRFLYVRSGNTNAVVVFATGANGALTPVQTLTGLPRGSNGIAVR